MSITVGFAGYECEDVLLYLAFCLMKSGKKVAIEDRTEHKILLGIMEAKDNVLKTGEWEETIYRGIVLTDAAVRKEAYDVVFLDFGYRVLHPRLYECGHLILATDGLPVHAALLSKIGQWERRQYLLIRNFWESVHTQQYLELLTEQKTEKTICIPWEEKDEKIREHLGETGDIPIGRLSAQMKEAVRQLILFLFPDIPENQTARLGRW